MHSKVKSRVFVKLYSRYAGYFPEYSNYIGRALILLKSLYGMTKSGKLFSDEFTEWLLEAGFIKYQYQMSIYYMYAIDSKQMFVVSYMMTLYIVILLKLLKNGLLML